MRFSPARRVPPPLAGKPEAGMRQPLRRRVFAAFALLTVSASLRGQEAERVWNFRVYLDDKPIGTHRFTLRGAGAERSLSSVAAFEVKVLGFTAYRYAHHATETWRDNCLMKMSARTNDDGKALSVEAAAEGERMSISATDNKESVTGCVMSFAYWNPQMLRQSRLLNAQTGQVEAVSIAAGADGSVNVNGKPVPARRYKLSGPKNPLDIWYTPGGEWLGLDSTVGGGRRLTYRLENGPG